MTLFSEKTLISNRCISGLTSNLIKKSWTVSILHVQQSQFSQPDVWGNLILLFVLPKKENIQISHRKRIMQNNFLSTFRIKSTKYLENFFRYKCCEKLILHLVITGWNCHKVFLCSIASGNFILWFRSFQN